MAEIKATGMHAGYVVMPLSEYNELMSQIEVSNREVLKAHSLAAEATLKAKQELADTLSNLCMVERQCWGDKKIVVHFNERAMFDLAMQKLVSTYDEADLAPYSFILSEEFILGDVTLGRRKQPDKT